MQAGDPYLIALYSLAQPKPAIHTMTPRSPPPAWRWIAGISSDRIGRVADPCNWPVSWFAFFTFLTASRRIPR